MVHTMFEKVITSHGVIAVEMTGGSGADVVLIHGNSSCRQVFQRQLHSDIGEQFRLICFDLPGHGQSSDAVDKARTYPLPGLADATLEMLQKINVKNPVLLGWSLGGHVAMEMVSRGEAFSGLFITGAPPVGPDISEGFRGNLLRGLASQGAFDQEQAKRFVQNVFAEAADPLFEEAAVRTDGAFRTHLFSKSRIDEKSNQKEVVRATHLSTAVVNGANDPVINLDYIDSVEYGNLWGGACVRVPDAGHAPFLQSPVVFNSHFRRYLREISG